MAEDQKWHLDRKVPIGLFVAIAIQTLVFAYFLGELSENVEHNGTRVTQLEARELARSAAVAENTTSIAVINQNLVEIRHSLERIEKNQEKLRD